MLREKRIEKGLTQDQLAKGANVSQQLISDFENDKKTPSVNVAKSIAKILEIDWTDFFKEELERV